MQRTALLAAALLAPAAADAFCGFYVAGSGEGLYNRATTVALMREGARTVLSMRNDYQGPPERFAMVVPVPVVLRREDVKTLPAEVFERLDRLAAPRLVEYWERDPCTADEVLETGGLGAVSGVGYGAGAGLGGAGAVRVEARFAVGEYDVVILSAGDSAGLDAWLRREGYAIPEGAARVLEPYVRGGMKFFVARVDPARVRFEGGHATLSPLRFHYDSPTFELPIRLGLLNSPGAQDLVVHVLARDQRYEAANRPNVTAPTNLDVADAVRADFPRFYAALFDGVLARRAGAVVTEYAWEARSCDPCPVPPLTPEELVTLGADVAFPAGPPRNAVPHARTAPPRVTGALAPEAIRRVTLRNLGQVTECHRQGVAAQAGAEGRVVVRFVIGPAGAVTSAAVASSTYPVAAAAECVAGAVRRWRFPAPERGEVTVECPFSLTVEDMTDGWGAPDPYRGFVLTRLHLRYGRDDVGEDLVFRAAPPISGGREEREAGGELRTDARPSDANDFQARYAIRHPWTGPVNCERPHRGVWGGAPSGVDPSRETPAAAVGTAFVQRGGTDLASMLRTPVEGVTAAPPPAPPRPTAPAPRPAAPAARSGCSRCAASPTDRARPPAALAALALAALGRRRRRLHDS